MKTELYPQLFDKIGAGFKAEGEYNGFYNKYKFNQLSGYALQKYQELQQDIKFINKKVQLPLALFSIISMLFIVLFCVILESLPEIGFKKAYQNAPILFWLLPVFLGLTIISYLFYRYKLKYFKIAVAELEETTGKEVNRLINENLNIPQTAVDVNFFQRHFRPKKNRPFAVFCETFSVFSDTQNIYFYWNAAVFKIPKRDCLTAEMTESKLVYFDHWPSVDYKLPEIKQYKIKRNSKNKVYITKLFGRLIFTADGEIWTLDVPPFAFETIKNFFKKE